MLREWLIRTKNNHILGPVTKEKIRQLITNGSIKGDDEVCAGNGYWFFVRELELVEKYIFGEKHQGFNPVQESLPVLTQISDRRNYPVQEATDGAILPSEIDLMYPGEDSSVKSQTNDTSIGFDPKKDPAKDLPLSPPRVPNVKNETLSEKLSDVRERAHDRAPKRPSKPISTEKKTIEQQAPKTKKKAQNLNPIPKNSMSGKRLIIITVVFVVLGTVLILFRGSLVKKFIESASLLIPSAHAQVTYLNKKKSGLINLL